jgi:cytochrome P450
MATAASPAPGGPAPDLTGFDPNAESLHADPYPVYRALLDQPTMVHSSAVGWVIARYADASVAMRDHERFRSDWGPKGPIPANIPRVRETSEEVQHTYSEFPVLPIEVDPPEHRAYRHILHAMFSAPAIRRDWSHEAQAVAAELLDGLAGQPGVEVTSQLAMPMSGGVLSAVLGIPPRDRGTFQAMTQDVNLNLADLLVYLDSAMASAPAGAFRLLSEAEIDGRKLTREEKRGFGIVLIHAGWETTATAISTMFFRLATTPGLRDRLQADRALIPGAVEEFLRIDTPVQAQWRTAACDLSLGGADVQRADKTLLLLGAANRDETVFPEADRVIPDRSPNRHLAFGVGVHRCLGAHLARLELQVMLAEALDRLPPFELDPAQPVSCTNGVVRVAHTVPLRFTAA